MKYHLIFTFFITFLSYGQSNLVFDKKNVQSKDKWVAFPADSTGSYNFGFISIDADAGLTFRFDEIRDLLLNQTFPLQ